MGKPWEGEHPIPADWSGFQRSQIGVTRADADDARAGRSQPILGGLLARRARVRGQRAGADRHDGVRAPALRDGYLLWRVPVADIAAGGERPAPVRRLRLTEKRDDPA